MSTIVLVICVKTKRTPGFKNKGAGWKFGVISSILKGVGNLELPLGVDLSPHSPISFITNKQDTLILKTMTCPLVSVPTADWSYSKEESD